MSDDDLLKMYKNGVNSLDKNNVRLDGHHYNQQSHRDNGAYIVEIPETHHDIGNTIQHPFGSTKGRGLFKAERKEWNNVRTNFNKERAKQELINRRELPF